MSTKKKTIKIEFTKNQMKSTLFILDIGHQILTHLAKTHAHDELEFKKLKKDFKGVTDLLHNGVHKIEGVTCKGMSSHATPKIGMLEVKHYETDEDEIT